MQPHVPIIVGIIPPEGRVDDMLLMMLMTARMLDGVVGGGGGDGVCRNEVGIVVLLFVIWL